MNNLYRKKQLKFENNIPIFSKTNLYIQNYEKIADDHVSSMKKNGDNPFIPKILWEDMENSTLKLIKKYSKKGNRILDVGVGMGRVLSHFPELDRYGMDISMKYLNIASKNGIKVCLSLIEDMPYSKNYFDIVICTDVLEHVIDLNLALKNILSVLKPEGYIIIRSPYKEDLSYYLHPSFPYEYVHIRNFDEFSLKILLIKAFNMEFMEMVKASYFGDKIKGYLGISYVRRFLNTIFNLISKIDNRTSFIIRKLFFNPTEINFVFKKK